MAKILENTQGRRMIRLSADDVLNILNIYQQHFRGEPPTSHKELKTRLAEREFYLPEDLS